MDSIRIFSKKKKKLFLIIVFFLVSIALAVNGCFRVAEKNQPPQNIQEVVVALDAGHGGNKGNGSSYGGVEEKDINLAVARYTQQLLEASGIKVLMIRKRDEFYSLEHRAVLSNSADADLFVSLHCNAYPEDPSAAGIVGFYQHTDDSSKKLAEILGKSAAEMTGANWLGASQSSQMYVTKHTHMPSALLEMGYMTNDQELALLAEKTYQQKLAEGIAQGIETYIDSFVLEGTQNDEKE